MGVISAAGYLVLMGGAVATPIIGTVAGFIPPLVGAMILMSVALGLLFTVDSTED